MKATLRQIYHSLPAPLRRTASAFGPLSVVRRRFFAEDTALHDTYYTEQYYADDVVGPATAAAPFICDDVIRWSAPRSVIDVGCGSGEYLDAFRQRGVEAHGIELASAALARCRQKGLDVVRLDLTASGELPWSADLVYSFEVAEHIAAAAALRFVGAIARAARHHVVLTAAPPGQAGLCHVNCQPKAYWIDLFGAEAFRYDADLTAKWSARNRSRGLAPWLVENLMVFHRDVPNAQGEANGETCETQREAWQSR